MNRIAGRWTELAAAGAKALIPYVTPYFPFRGATVPVMRALESAGADMIEVGIPFSDPLADGSTIQHSSEVALNNGATLGGIFASVAEFRSASTLPVLLMGYVNPVYRFGVIKFLDACVESGVDGLIIPDLPPEEGSELRRESAARGISSVFLIAPTSSDERIRQIDGYSTDFSYCVSITGVTGARQDLGGGDGIEAFLRRVRSNVSKKFVVGFGISTAAHVARVWQHADGAVVGSALITTIASAQDAAEAASRAGAFLHQLRPL